MRLSMHNHHKSVTPSPDELTDAIKAILAENEHASQKEICEALSKAYESWKVPERRVAKFVKRQKKGRSTFAGPHENAADDDDSHRSGSTTGETESQGSPPGKKSRGLRKRIGNLLRSGDKRKHKGSSAGQETAPPKEMSIPMHATAAIITTTTTEISLPAVLHNENVDTDNVVPQSSASSASSSSSDSATNDPDALQSESNLVNHQTVVEQNKPAETIVESITEAQSEPKTEESKRIETAEPPTTTLDETTPSAAEAAFAEAAAIAPLQGKVFIAAPVMSERAAVFSVAPQELDIYHDEDADMDNSDNYDNDGNNNNKKKERPCSMLEPCQGCLIL